MPKKDVHHYQDRLQASVIGVFNTAQQEQGKGTCSNGSASAWLKAERPKLKIYPHQADYCDTCAKMKEEINGLLTTLKRKRQTGSTTEEEQKKIESDIQKAEDSLAAHKHHATKAREYYNAMVLRCQDQWKAIQAIDEGQLQHNPLLHGFTLTLSVDYQMSKLVPYWGCSPQPGSTYYLQKLSHDLLGIIDQRRKSSGIFI